MAAGGAVAAAASASTAAGANKSGLLRAMVAAQRVQAEGSVAAAFGRCGHAEVPCCTAPRERGHEVAGPFFKNARVPARQSAPLALGCEAVIIIPVTIPLLERKHACRAARA